MAKTVADVMKMVKDNEIKFVDFRFARCVRGPHPVCWGGDAGDVEPSGPDAETWNSARRARGGVLPGIEQQRGHRPAVALPR